MKLKVEHTTLFEYEAPVYETATEVRLQPVDNHGAAQRCLDFTLEVNPPTSIFQYTDFYGTSVHHFNVLPSHKSLEITATSVVETGEGRSPAAPNEELYLYDFKSESRYIRFAPAIQEYSRQFKEISDSYILAESICRNINDTFIYERGVTNVSSTSAEVMALRRGVCQDFAHVMIAICRYLGVPTRYVSGYLYGGAETENENRASHAWCEVYCGSERGWIGFDPTHRTLLVDERYIKIGSGRDYADVTPVRGTYKGSSREHLKVFVRIAAVSSGL
jgi:transglutaminase-like putative cysteine protease